MDPPDRRIAAGQRQQEHGIDGGRLGQSLAQSFQHITLGQVHLEDGMQIAAGVLLQPVRHQQTDLCSLERICVVAEQIAIIDPGKDAAASLRCSNPESVDGGGISHSPTSP
jgi:hypothetical protein